TSSVILPPEPVTETSTLSKEPLFEQVPIEEEKERPEKKIDQVIEKLKKSAPQESKKSEKAEKIEPAPATEKAAASKSVKEVEKIEPKPVKKVQQNQKPAAAKGSYYIQVGAFFRYPPDKKFLESIKREGLNYIIVEGEKSGKPYKKVLVGPYASKSEAAKDLAKVKKRINQNAYITRKK
ncbi:MAG: SPOR domain-containing protein, partial [Hydrogenimonas sp.]|nr:SPOR domain-containing protein [Hydrogenimonas sp.]